MSDQENLPVPHSSESGTIRYKKSAKDVLVEKVAPAHYRAVELTRRGIVPAIVEGPLQQVLDVCTKAIHGGEVSTETTLSVIRVGLYILDILHSLPSTSPQESSTTT